MCLRVIGDELDPDIVTSLLNHQPTKAHKTGDDISSPKSRRKRIAKTGVWMLEAPTEEPGNINSQATYLLSNLSGDINAWKSISESYRIDLFCGLFMEETNEGIDLEPSVLYEIGKRGILIDFDIYGGD